MRRDTLSFGVPVDLHVLATGGYVAMCDRVPMLLAGKDPADAAAHVDRALAMVANHLLSKGPDAARAYLKRRGIEGNVETEEFAKTPHADTPHVYRFGAGVFRSEEDGEDAGKLALAGV